MPDQEPLEPGQPAKPAVRFVRKTLPAARSEFDALQHRAKVGLMGWWFGDSRHSGNNIIGITLVGLLVLLAILLVAIIAFEMGGKSSAVLAGLVATIVPAVTGLAGYLVGLRRK